MSTSKIRRAKPLENGSEPRPHAAYFLSLELRNIRCFDEAGQTLNLSDRQGKPSRWTILLGYNGTGKTTILRSLTAFELVPHAKGQDGSIRKRPWPRAFRWPASGFLSGLVRGSNNSVAELKVLVSQGLAFNSDVQDNRVNEMSLTSTDSATTTLSSPHYSPMCYGYGALRRLGSTSLRSTEAGDATSSLFRDDVDLVDAEEWLLRLDYSASKSSEIQEQQQKRREQVKDLLLNILPEVEDIRFAVPTKARPDPTVEFQTPYGWVPLRQLSHGYQTMIAWMVDLASRMVDRYPDSPDPLAEPAVVLVDEIDLHLHPRWQRDLIGYLTERFPNTQFIATAHSPLIVQAASDANIAVLRREGDHVVIDNDVEPIKNWRIDQILTSDLFGLRSARPPQIDELMRRRQELLTRPKLTKAARTELAEIEAKIGDLPTGETPEQIDLMKRIDATLKSLEDRQGPKG